MQRRFFLASILAAGVAPAAVGSSILMPVKKIAAPFPEHGYITFPAWPQDAWFGVDQASVRVIDTVDRATFRKTANGWQLVEVSLVDARGWPLDDPCRIRCGNAA